MVIIFPLNKTGAWVPLVALLLLCFSICPHSSYPHAQEDEDPVDEEGDEDSEENQQQLIPNEDEDPEEQVAVDEAAAAEESEAESSENDNKNNCVDEGKVCTKTADCCESKMSRFIIKCRKFVEFHESKKCLNEKKPGACSDYLEDCKTTADCCKVIFAGKDSEPDCRYRSDLSETKTCLPKPK